MRQIVLDTETTGLEASQGHKIIEIGCVELINRRMTGNNYHQYIDPQREIDEAAIEVHGITLADLQGKPLFADLAEGLFEYLKGAELIIHNAPFDVGFLNVEFEQAGMGKQLVNDHCEIMDSLVMARQKHPGQKNNLDALCRRYEVDNSQRTLHGALLDAEILADVYLMMTGGQTTLLGESHDLTQSMNTDESMDLDLSQLKMTVVEASPDECEMHEKWLDMLDKQSDNGAVWRQQSSSE